MHAGIRQLFDGLLHACFYINITYKVVTVISQSGIAPCLPSSCGIQLAGDTPVFTLSLPEVPLCIAFMNHHSTPTFTSDFSFLPSHSISATDSTFLPPDSLAIVIARLVGPTLSALNDNDPNLCHKHKSYPNV